MLNIPLVAQKEDFTCAAACFESMLRFFKGSSPSEADLAQALGTYDLGYTDPSRVMYLARFYRLRSSLHEGVTKAELMKAFRKRKVIFVTWWDEDAGHYSLIKSIDDYQVVLMDPWHAREGQFNRIKTKEFIGYWSQRGNKMITVSE